MEHSNGIVIHNRYAGYAGDNYNEELFCQKNIREMSEKISHLLKGVDPNGRNIIVPDKTIVSVMSDIYNNFVPKDIGNVWSRSIDPTSTLKQGVQDVIDDTIKVIVSDVKNNIGTIENNKKLSIWTTVLGDFNAHGMMAHSKIKVRHNTLNYDSSTRY